MENNIIVNKFTTINSYDSRIKINKVEGSHYQKTRNGYNLFNPNKALSKTTKTQGGATVTKNIDGSFNITGSGQLSSDFGGDYVDYTHEETLKLLKVGLLKCDFGAVTCPNCFVEFFKKVDGKSTRLFVLENNTNPTVSKEITEEILNSEGLFIRLSFYGGNGNTIKPGKIQPMLYQEGDGTFEQFGKSPSPEYPSKIETVGSNGNIELNVVNKNIMPIKIGQYWEYTQNGIQNKGRNEGAVLTEFKVPKGQTIKINVIFKTLPTTDTSFIGYVDNVNIKELRFEQFSLNLTVNKLYTKTYTPTKDETISYRMYGNTNSDIFEFQIWAEINEVTNYEKHQSYNEIIPIQKEMLDGDYIYDKEYHTWGKYVCTGNENWILSGKAFYIDTITDYAIINNIPICNYFPGVPNVTGSQSGSFDKACVAFINTLESKRFYICYPEITTVDDLKAFLQEKHNSGNPVTIYYKLANILELPLKEEQKEIMNQSIYLYNGDTNIFINSTNSPKIYYDTEKIINDFDFYISKEGYLVIPEYNTKYLINFDESSIPSMPEAVEAAVRAAGRDGDFVLNTTYEPISFIIACYTEDNLSIEEKVEHEAKINIFLNSMKNKTKKFAIEKDNKFYEVKYNAALTTINYPAHLKFSIPFKTSESYAKETKEKNIIGNASEISNTINNVGAIFTIKGPATNPIISLNDYSMEYSMSILEGARIEINSNKSTITHINSDGVKTNVMKYYNHQFPKIENGTNTLKILSGIEEESQVSVKWRDLKL